MSTPTYDRSRGSSASSHSSLVSHQHGVTPHDDAPLVSALLGVDFLQLDERFSDARPTLAIIRQGIELQMQKHESLLRQRAAEPSTDLLGDGTPASGSGDGWIR